jgi:hypothetical protein
MAAWVMADVLRVVVRPSLATQFIDQCSINIVYTVNPAAAQWPQP